jgi:hypothetical protein
MVRHHVKKKKNDSKSSAQRKKEEEKQLEEELQNLDRFAGSSDEEDANEENNNSVDQFSEDEDIPAENGGDGSDSSEQSGSESEDGSAADEDDDYDDVYQEDMKAPHKHMKVNKNERESDSGDDDEEEDSEDDYADAIDKQSDDYDDDELISSSFTSSQRAKGAGMANAMARILGGQLTMQPEKTSESASKKGTKPVILSKTTTPLQRLQQKMKTEEQALRQKRLNRRAENLSAMRLPLAPSAGMSAEKLWKETKKSNRKRNIEDDNDAAAIANEIEGERTHRRIATRGVVALFNAISKHRAAVAAEAAAKEQEKRDAREEGRSARKKGEESGVSSQTKHGFLDMIKKSVKKDESGADGTRKQGGSTPQNGENNKKDSTVGWSALKDDYMMNSKLKDWDKMSDDDDDDEPSKFDAASFSDGEQELHKSSSRKRLKV